MKKKKHQMRVKRKFQLNGNTWVVKYQRHMDSDGSCDFNTKTIFLSESLTIPDKIETLKHEINHAIIDELLLNETHGLTPAQQETLAEGFRLHYNKLFDIRWKLGKPK